MKFNPTNQTNTIEKKSEDLDPQNFPPQSFESKRPLISFFPILTKFVGLM
jgi:hypothetical protein